LAVSTLLADAAVRVEFVTVAQLFDRERGERMVGTNPIRQ
jgi:hypothetical protein